MHLYVVDKITQNIKKTRKSTKAVIETKPSPLVGVQKPAVAEAPPSTEASDLSASDDSDEVEQDDSEDEHESFSTEEEVPKASKKASQPIVTPVTSGGTKEKKKRVKA